MKFFLKMFFVLFALLFFIYPSPSFCYGSHSFESYSLSVDIDDDTVYYVYEGVVLFEDEGVDYELVFTPDIENFELFLNDAPVLCDVSYTVGGSVADCNMSDVLAGRNYIAVSYESAYPFFDLGNMKMFSDSFDFGSTVESFKLSIKLPFGYVLPDMSEYFVTPEAATIYSNGRRHILFWEAQNVSSFEVSVIMEPSSDSRSPAFYAVIVIIALFLALIVWHYVRRRNRVKTKEIVYSHLLEGEIAVVDALEANMGVLKQKELQAITSFSKAKLSRIISNLENRDIVNKKPFGNSNRIFLARKDKRTAGNDAGNASNVS